MTRWGSRPACGCRDNRDSRKTGGRRRGGGSTNLMFTRRSSSSTCRDTFSILHRSSHVLNLGPSHPKSRVETTNVDTLIPVQWNGEIRTRKSRDFTPIVTSEGFLRPPLVDGSRGLDRGLCVHYELFTSKGRLPKGKSVFPVTYRISPHSSDKTRSTGITRQKPHRVE